MRIIVWRGNIPESHRTIWEGWLCMWKTHENSLYFFDHDERDIDDHGFGQYDYINGRKHYELRREPV